VPCRWHFGLPILGSIFLAFTIAPGEQKGGGCKDEIVGIKSIILCTPEIGEWPSLFSKLPVSPLRVVRQIEKGMPARAVEDQFSSRFRGSL
jgi:hypothetical protein